MLFDPGNRNFGLDIARSIAISLVLIAHSGITFLFGINLGFLGVEIFFVLSGFLIGQIILREFKTEVTLQNCGTFYINRWLRTFPLYYLVLISKDMIAGEGFYLNHYLFIQHSEDLVFFPVSWSLAIEEWFYILIPLVFIINTRLIRLSHLTFISLLMLIVMMYRFYFIQTANPVFDLDVRKAIPLRFDALLVGVLFSLFKANFNSAYISVSNYRSLILSSVLFIAGFFIYKKFVLLEQYAEPGITKSFFQTMVFVFFSFSFGFFIIWLEQCSLNKLSKKNIFLRLITTLSILTYAIYLIHYDIFKMIFVSPVYSAPWLLELLKASALVIAISAAMHLLIEKPAMDYRKVLIKKIFERKTI